MRSSISCFEINNSHSGRMMKDKSFFPDSVCYDTGCECSRERGTKTSKGGPYPGAVGLVSFDSRSISLSSHPLMANPLLNGKMVLVPNGVIFLVRFCLVLSICIPWYGFFANLSWNRFYFWLDI